MKNSENLNRISRSRAVWLHITCWVMFILYELWMLWYSGAGLEPAWHYLLFYTVNISFFYLLVMAFDRADKHFVKAVLPVFGAVLLYLLGKAAVTYAVSGGQFTTDYQSLMRFLASAVFRGGYFLLLALFYRAATHIAAYRLNALNARRNELEVRIEKADLEIRVASERNAFLQQQINPHLLFNALNFIYSRIEPADADAGRCVLLLSDLLRFSLEAPGWDGKCSLAAELEQISNLIALNRYRFNDQLYLNYQVSKNAGNMRIIPLILLTLAENLFKHGDLSNQNDPAVMDIRIDGSTLSFYSHNRKRPEGPRAGRNVSGLDNIRLRLEHGYGKSQNLETGETSTHFTVKLLISLDSQPLVH